MRGSGGGRVAFDMNGKAQVRRGCFSNGNQFQIVFEAFNRRHEHAKPPVTGFDRQRRPYGRVTDFHPPLALALARVCPAFVRPAVKWATP